MEIAIGTSNPAKLRQCKVALGRTGLRLRPLDELLEHPPDIPEDGRDAEENAVRKAQSYCELVGIPVLSLDYALVFDDVPADVQPGPTCGGYPAPKHN